MTGEEPDQEVSELTEVLGEIRSRLAERERDLEVPELTEALGEIRSRLEAIEVKLDSIEAQVETFAVVDLDSALDDVRAEVRSIKDEML